MSRAIDREDERTMHELALAAARAAIEKKAADVVLLDVRELTSLADEFVIASGRSDTQVRAIAEAVEEALRALRTEIGEDGGARGPGATGEREAAR